MKSVTDQIKKIFNLFLFSNLFFMPIFSMATRMNNQDLTNLFGPENLKNMNGLAQSIYTKRLTINEIQTKLLPATTCFKINRYLIPQSVGPSSISDQHTVLIVNQGCILKHQNKEISGAQILNEYLALNWFANLTKTDRNTLQKNIYNKRLFNLLRTQHINWEQNIEDLFIYVVADLIQKNINPRTIIDNIEDLKISPDKAQIQYLAESNKAFFSRYKLIENAQSEIKFQTFILKDDFIGNALMYKLIEAKRRGVKIDLMLDARGSMAVLKTPMISALIHEGINVKVYNKVSRSLNPLQMFKVGLVDSIVAGNHDKILLVDNKNLIIGGRNISTEYFLNTDETQTRDASYTDFEVYLKSNEPFLDAKLAFNIEYYSPYAYTAKVNHSRSEIEDTLIQMENYYNLVVSLMTGKEFYTSSYLMGKIRNPNITSLSGFLNYQDELSEKHYEFVSSDKTSLLLNYNELTNKTLSLISNAKKDITLLIPYITFNTDLISALKAAKNNNPKVKITIITAGATGTHSTITVAHYLKSIDKVIEEVPDINFIIYNGPERLHAKAFIIDDEISSIGSNNLDSLSQKINSEFNVIFFSPEITADLKSLIIEHSKEQNIIKIKSAKELLHNVPEKIKNSIIRQGKIVKLLEPWL